MLSKFFEYILGLSSGIQTLCFIIFLIVGFVLLIKGADLFVDNSACLARRLGVSSLIIGLTIVSFGTSAPEASVSINSSLSGSPNLSIGNLIGSNIFNLLVVLGASVIFSKITVQKEIIKRDIPFMIFSSLLLLIFALFFGKTDYVLLRIEGAILLFVFLIFISMSIISAKKHSKDSKIEDSNIDNTNTSDTTNNNLDEEANTTDNSNSDIKKSFLILFGLLIVGLISIIVGGELVTFGAKNIAINIGVSENLVGLTIVAVGTSLPELITSIIAAKKNEIDIAVGNVVGSNIFNLIFVLGAASSISEMKVSLFSIIDMIIMSILFIFTFIYLSFKRTLGKKEGIFMIFMYAIYLTYIICRDFL